MQVITNLHLLLQAISIVGSWQQVFLLQNLDENVFMADSVSSIYESTILYGASQRIITA